MQHFPEGAPGDRPKMNYCPYCDAQILQPNPSFCPNCGKPIFPATETNPPAPQQEQQQQQQARPQPLAAANPLQQQAPPEQQEQQQFDIRTILFPGESIAWELNIKEGIIHRHVEKAYAITNQRVLAIDAINNRVAISLPLRQTDLVVMDRRTASQSAGSGVYNSGVYAGTRSGSSRSIGTLVFMAQGIERIRLGGVADPEGVKNLFYSIRREAT